MEIDRDKIKTLEESDEEAPMDLADARAKAEMNRLQKEARREVAEGLQEDELNAKK